MIRIVAVSDLHGYLPVIPPCDLCIIAGDICPTTDHSVRFQKTWLDTVFRDWLTEIPAQQVVGIAGNHDLIFEAAPSYIPLLPWTYLQDSGTEHKGLKIWGTPWQPFFHDWAFNLYERQLCEKWEMIPRDTDILVVHGPPLGFGDNAPRENKKGFEHTGSIGLRIRIEEIKPKLVIFGHIHEGRGEWDLGPTKLANVTVVNGNYNHVYSPWEFEL